MDSVRDQGDHARLRQIQKYTQEIKLIFRSEVSAKLLQLDPIKNT